MIILLVNKKQTLENTKDSLIKQQSKLIDEEQELRYQYRLTATLFDDYQRQIKYSKILQDQIRQEMFTSKYHYIMNATSDDIENNLNAITQRLTTALTQLDDSLKVNLNNQLQTKQALTHCKTQLLKEKENDKNE